MIKNLRFYRVHSEWPDTEEALSGQLENVQFKPCSAFSERSMGFEPPVENAGDLLARRLAGADLIQLRLQSRVLPIAAVKEALVDRVASFVSRTGRDPSRKEKRELKEEVYGELLPKALLKSDRIAAFYIRTEKILAVATPSATNAERMLDSLRSALDSLQAVPLEYKQPAFGLMTKIFLGDGPNEFALGRECRMKDLTDPKSTVNWLDMDLADSSIRAHVKGGLSIDRLGVAFDSLFRCTLDQELVVRKIRLEGIEELDDLDDEDPLARHDAEFTLFCGLTTKLLAALKKNLGGYAH
jgi:recombination associated protein RdgC